MINHVVFFFFVFCFFFLFFFVVVVFSSFVQFALLSLHLLVCLKGLLLRTSMHRLFCAVSDMHACILHARRSMHAGVIQAVGTGDPTDVSSFFAKTKVTFQGRAVAILRPSAPAAAGSVTLTVSAPDAAGKIAPTTITVQIV